LEWLTLKLQRLSKPTGVAGMGAKQTAMNEFGDTKCKEEDQIGVKLCFKISYANSGQEFDSIFPYPYLSYR